MKLKLFTKTKSSLSRSEKLSRALYLIAIFSFLFSIIYVPLRAALDAGYRENSEYKIMIFQSVFGLLVVHLPSILEKRFMWRIPKLFSAVFTLFLWAAIFLGEVMDFYYRIPYWDNILHLVSSMMLGLLGFSLIDILNSDKRHTLVKLSPFFVSLFSVAFAVLIGVLWEIYEFAFDGILGLNMQKFAVPSQVDGEKLSDLSGRSALTDTMTDLIIDLGGAIISSAIGYISLKRGKGWLGAFKVELSAKQTVSPEAADTEKNTASDKPLTEADAQSFPEASVNAPENARSAAAEDDVDSTAANENTDGEAAGEISDGMKNIAENLNKDLNIADRTS